MEGEKVWLVDGSAFGGRANDSSMMEHDGW